MTESTNAEFPGNGDHPDHEEWLLELGRATYAAAKVAVVAFDLARVLGGVEGSAMYDDPLGALKRKLEPLRKRKPALPLLEDFMKSLDGTHITRNDVLHALPVAHGLHRRRTKDPHYVWNFFTVESLKQASDEMNATARLGNIALYADGGAAANAWSETKT